MNKDLEHLDLLGTFHYVVGGLMALVACFPIIHLVIGLIMIFNPGWLDSRANQPPAIVGWIFVLFAGAFMLLGWTTSALVIWAGRCLKRRRRHTYCLVMACILCAFMPLGTVLGVFTIIALVRPEIKSLFGLPIPSGGTFSPR